MYDTYIDEMLSQGKLRPKTGHILAEKLSNRGQFYKLGDKGMVEGELRPSGLIIPQTKTAESLSVLARTYLVRRLGPTPLKWSCRFFDKERLYKASWDALGIKEGTVIACRAVAGVDQDRRSNFIELRYDEIVALAQPEDSELEVPIPAPGWVVVTRIPEQYSKSLILSDNANSIMKTGHILKARVDNVSAFDDQLNIGDIVYVPMHSGTGATEWVEIGDWRILPLEDILGVEIND